MHPSQRVRGTHSIAASTAHIQPPWAAVPAQAALAISFGADNVFHQFDVDLHLRYAYANKSHT